MRKILMKYLCLVLMFCVVHGVSCVGSFASGVENAVVNIGEEKYETLTEALASAKTGDVVELSEGTFEFGEVLLPTELVDVTLRGSGEQKSVIKNSFIKSADSEKLTYTGVKIENIVFDNSYVFLTSKGTGDTIYRDWMVSDCVFTNIVTPDENTCAFHYKRKGSKENFVNFSFVNNVVDGVSGGQNSGVRLENADGEIIFKGNTFKNIAWNAMQVVNATENTNITLAENSFSDVMSEEGIINLYNVKGNVSLTKNTLIKKSEKQPFICNFTSFLSSTDNTWIDEKGNKLSDEEAVGELLWEKDVELEKAIERFNTLGITKGLEENYFRANKSVTREQMIAFIYRLLNKGELAAEGKNKAVFTDVENPETIDMISWAYEKGIIKGTGEGTFNPLGNITLRDCYVICLRALGYENNESLSYPNDYIRIAETIRLDENLKEMSYTDELTRNDVGKILYNTLYAKMKDGDNLAVKTYNRHFLDGKKILFVGNSYTFFGNAVMRKDRTELDIESRRNDKGYFYTLCKTNNAEPEITNWTWGGHSISNIFAEKCTAPRECNGQEHLANLTDLDYDYVIMQQGREEEHTLEIILPEMERFKQANPETKFVFLIHANVYYRNFADVSEFCAQMKELGVPVVNWGKLVYDIANQNVSVPGAVEQYSKNSFIIRQSEDDGYHQNLLSGYITALMTYSAISGESAVGQEYEFCNDRTLHPSFNFDEFEKSYYKYDGAKTNFPEIFASKSDMKGIQELADIYLTK